MKLHFFEITPLDNVAKLRDLAAEAETEGMGMVRRLVADWEEGRNRFDQPGEKAFVAVAEGKVVAVCGLNVDPFAGAARVGRVRRLYVSREYRRRGVGSTMVARVAKEAAGWFDVLHLRTHDVRAAAFYEALGFVRVEGDVRCTHQRAVA
jgi:GNAT superfamily N-acetyltransferase